MVEQGFRGLMITFIIIGIFSFSMIAFGAEFANDNNLNNKVIGNAYRALNSSLIAINSTVSSQKTAVEEDKGILAVAGFILESIKSTGTLFTTSILSLYNVTFGLIFDTFLGAEFGIISIAFGSIMIVIIILLAWRLYKI